MMETILNCLYVLDGHEVVPCLDFKGWAQFMEKQQNRVDMTTIRGLTTKEDSVISTVFLGLDLKLFHSGPARVFETYVFGGPHDNYKEQYYSWDEAKAGHVRIAQMVQESLK